MRQQYSILAALYRYYEVAIKLLSYVILSRLLSTALSIVCTFVARDIA